MHALVVVCLALGVVLAPAPIAAQEAEALRQKLDRIRRERREQFLASQQPLNAEVLTGHHVGVVAGDAERLARRIPGQTARP